MRTSKEVLQFRDDQQQYARAEQDGIHILHLSDLHIESGSQAAVYRTQLETDLTKELGVRRLDYLVLSGDIASHANEDEYRAAFELVDGLVKRFGLDPDRVLVVPGNHDVNWTKSEQAYQFVFLRHLPAVLPMEKYIPAGDIGGLMRDDRRYRDRFGVFSSHFYRRVYPGRDYPDDDAKQIEAVERPGDHTLFLGLNSCWNIDHYFRERASIHMPAVSFALNRLQEGDYDGWLKIAVRHHPVSGMNEEFMQLLAVHGFQVCLHGHIHEAINGFHYYDEGRSIRVVGAGTFGAPTRERVAGIPLHCNLLVYDREQGEITVRTRKKEKVSGAWAADARWGGKNDPRGSYAFSVQPVPPSPSIRTG